MRIVVADRSGVYTFKPEDANREIFYAGDFAVVSDEPECEEDEE
jgi:hypothetical protein